MPPKTGSASPSKSSGSSPPSGGVGGDAKSAAADPSAVPFVPDPDVLRYLEHATRVFPRVEAIVEARAKLYDARIAEAKQSVAAARQQQRETVGKFRATRRQLEGEIERVKREVAQVKNDIVAEEERFATALQEAQSQYDTRITELRTQLSRLTEDDATATHWNAIKREEVKRLFALKSTIQEVQGEHQRELDEMERLHQVEQRRLRDALVKRLRKARDAISVADDTALIDAATAGGQHGGGGDGAQQFASSTGLSNGSNTNTGAEEALEGGASGGPTARQNEQLSREITIYEREATQLQRAIADLQTDEATLKDQLKDLRSKNEALLERNASHAKTKKILRGKVKELETQLTQLTQTAHVQKREKVSALRNTTMVQGFIIDELNAEMEDVLRKIDEARKRLRGTQLVAVARDMRIGLAMRFFMRCTAAAPSRAAVELGSEEDTCDALLLVEQLSPPSSANLAVEQPPTYATNSNENDHAGSQTQVDPVGRNRDAPPSLHPLAIADRRHPPHGGAMSIAAAVSTAEPTRANYGARDDSAGGVPAQQQQQLLQLQVQQPRHHHDPPDGATAPPRFRPINQRLHVINRLVHCLDVGGGGRAVVEGAPARRDDAGTLPWMA